ncbi:MAG TPA: hypothetical protein VNM37_21955, partial [Candidatus Dormibacteraeota bacterium]|nr:hypothetical protein [Candidatus Dormibacteraeota bacterium]
MDDFGGFDSGGFSLFGGDTPDFGTSYDFGGDVGSLYGGGSDLMGQFSLGGPSTLFDTSGLGGGAMGGTNGLNLTMPGGGGGLPMGGGGGQPGGGGAMGGLGSLQG